MCVKQRLRFRADTHLIFYTPAIQVVGNFPNLRSLNIVGHTSNFNHLFAVFLNNFNFLWLMLEYRKFVLFSHSL